MDLCGEKLVAQPINILGHIAMQLTLDVFSIKWSQIMYHNFGIHCAANTSANATSKG